VNGILQMRKWALWYTAGFRGAGAIRQGLLGITRLEELDALLDRLDPAEPFPLWGLRHSRAKGGRRRRCGCRRVARPTRRRRNTGHGDRTGLGGTC
jgi:hypothetical protein